MPAVEPIAPIDAPSRARGAVRSGGSREGRVLLVHGAWHTGTATWSGVATALRERGVEVGVAELHRGSLAADTHAAERLLRELATGGPVVVCGHSFGGAIITGLPPEHMKHLVYLCAVMPNTGESALGLAATTPATALMDAVRPVTADGSVTVLDPVLAGPALYGHLAEPEQAHHVAQLVPQQMAAGYQAPAAIAWRTVPSTYVVATDDRSIHPALQRRLASRATTVLEWDSDHAPFASSLAPALIDLLFGLATGTAGLAESRP